MDWRVVGPGKSDQSRPGLTVDFGSDGSQFMIFGARDWRQKASFFQFVNIAAATVNWVGAELMIAMLTEAACQVRITSYKRMKTNC